ncbi:MULTISPECIES: DcaP family trimeric outer membrane transporter [unclassified Lysobacter]|uniref:DcaP family trimeric outer membrane transporter n=1 Tax=unclassified Lysobacter TaxID=2635362 RepID=UPI001BEA75D1|nr:MULTISPECIES: DcaP family trimeric outer membrane transporter [unclassified Lysobacter]MBT2748629.1 hypothetical protein [Lysobacter sp. ISL-42]MBT2751564.1 hypothetical protein [Lysobacter sp. ISL-50]MBT2775758.1 hypothetical protein [Lysobacter sp. ISL-54]MBT2782277.1 hypothetical protein [Lysobacter sp. ISL-52]
MNGSVGTTLGLVLFGIAIPAIGQEVLQPDSRAALKAEMETLRQRLSALESRLEKLESPHENRAAPAVPAAPAPVTAQADESHLGTNIELYGFAQIDAIQDFDRVHPDWEDTLRPSVIPTTEGLYGGRGRFTAGVRQSRLGVKATRTTEYGDAFVNLEADMFGVGQNAGQTTLRLRHAYGQLGPFLAGQTNSLFVDGDVFPNVLDYWGPTGLALFRTVQFRWTPFSGRNSLAFAIEDATDSIDTGRFGRQFPDFGEHAQGRNRYPDVSAQFRMNRSWGHFQASGLLRRIGFETAGTPGNEPRGNATAYGLSLTSTMSFAERDRLVMSALGGRGIANYMNDGGVDLVPDDSPPGVIPDAVALPLWAGVLYYDRWWNQHWSSSLGYSFVQVDNTNNQTADAYHKGEYASVNLINRPSAAFLIGAEYLWGRRTDHDGASSSDRRLQLTVKYSFSNKD